MSKREAPHNQSRLRCAIYTRKSSEEGLEQEFNSLDVQREACAAYIKSQRHAGWIPLPDRYDDGGLSGGTMERPALQRLLEDVRSGKVHVIVVYKVDRLTRSTQALPLLCLPVAGDHGSPARSCRRATAPSRRHRSSRPG